ncbi:hypothetical protein B0G74_8855 [Paraburkholderia sp. BL9I2N2]|nr:hypothetical protein B0G74_8855 [Paraburkholderia sp. BL9I2N2]
MVSFMTMLNPRYTDRRARAGINSTEIASMVPERFTTCRRQSLALQPLVSQISRVHRPGSANESKIPAKIGSGH